MHYVQHKRLRVYKYRRSDLGRSQDYIATEVGKNALYSETVFRFNDKYMNSQSELSLVYTHDASNGWLSSRAQQ